MLCLESNVIGYSEKNQFAFTPAPYTIINVHYSLMYVCIDLYRVIILDKTQYFENYNRIFFLMKTYIYMLNIIFRSRVCFEVIRYTYLFKFNFARVVMYMYEYLKSFDK